MTESFPKTFLKDQPIPSDARGRRFGLLKNICLTFMIIVGSFLTQESFGIHLGGGFSSTFKGRQIPLLGFGTDLGKHFLSASTVGTQTGAYYESSYNANYFIFWKKWGQGWFGEVWTGFGGGAYFAKKALLTDPDTGEEEEDLDFGVGPAFRVESRPFGTMYIAIDFTMGLGLASIGGGWGDTGSLTFGVVL